MTVGLTPASHSRPLATQGDSEALATGRLRCLLRVTRTLLHHISTSSITSFDSLPVIQHVHICGHFISSYIPWCPPPSFFFLLFPPPCFPATSIFFSPAFSSLPLLSPLFPLLPSSFPLFLPTRLSFYSFPSSSFLLFSSLLFFTASFPSSPFSILSLPISLFLVVAFPLSLSPFPSSPP